ncbi:MAG: tRNA (adenosine(37)-N6)-threonylcarbamoyltransferase complex ATPase subunit type 1 TsaE [Desulfobulbaceae bacterium]|nr:tRNA (adenosine(37)-N6)-threonylcarbamoyltransferase complex ATPase subunit type 1 TsaE [Desulfobulbaceae bacterium]HIJ79714.1 tRNA (adenosine(37)-N6)-threonylcarbamoyltransferase complex ATPase subunit type 1 TsaE [Deltaproteobacteria bacterium]
MTSILLLLKDLEASTAFGLHLGKVAGPGDVITLDGSLGAGKTTITQAIGQGLAVPPDQYITSPTYSLLHEYLGRLPLYHMDLYRLAGEEEIEELGFEDYIYGNGLTVIEWPDRLGSLMPADRLHIELTSTSETARRAQLTAHGEGWRQRVLALLNHNDWAPEKLTD